MLNLVDLVIDSFKYSETPANAVGLPLGNVTSQLFANIYLHELDNFVKQTLRKKHYLRYCDDFVILAPQRAQLRALIQPIETFLQERLRLTLHPQKIILRELRQGIDYLRIHPLSQAPSFVDAYQEAHEKKAAEEICGLPKPAD